MLLRDSAGGLAVTLFGEPAPLRRGPVDLSVLVQDEGTGATVLDGEVDLVLEAPAGSGAATVRVRPDAAHATNKLLRAASIEFDATGTWSVRVDVSRGGRQARISGPIEVAPARPTVLRLWPWLLLPFLATGLFAWREWLRLRRPGSVAGLSGPGRRPPPVG